MHSLDSVMLRVNLFDEVDISPAKEFSVEYDIPITGRGSVERAYGVLCEEATAASGIFPVSVRVKKGIPIGGGLGGSSADSAALMRYFGIKDAGIALLAGSDVPYMSLSGGARVQGLGEKITPVLHPKMNLVFLNAGSVLSRESFAKFDELYGKPFCPTDNGRLVEALERGELKDIGRLMSNALTLPSVALNPKIKDAFSLLMQFNPLGAVMTGSGGGVIALFESGKQADRVALETGGRAIETVQTS